MQVPIDSVGFVPTKLALTGVSPVQFGLDVKDFDEILLCRGSGMSSGRWQVRPAAPSTFLTAYTTLCIVRRHTDQVSTLSPVPSTRARDGEILRAWKLHIGRIRCHQPPDYGTVGVENRTRTLFGQVMWSAAATAGLFALGAQLGRNLGNGWAFVVFILAFVCLIGMRFAIRSSAGLGIVLRRPAAVPSTASR